MKAYYVESSALLAWLFNEENSKSIIKILNDNTVQLCTSRITFIECERTIIRAETLKNITSAEAKKLQGWLAIFESEWQILEIGEDVYNGTKVRFPVEPVRTLDAIHLSTALQFHAIYEAISVLTFDQRIIDNLEPLGINMHSF